MPRGPASRFAAWAARGAETGKGTLVVFLLALLAWWLQAVALPLAPGRDLGTYLGAYVQLFHEHPIDLGYVLGRTPGSSLIVGGALDVAHGLLAEPLMSLLYAASVTAWFLAARALNVRAALLVAVVLLLYPGYAILFHELSSDAVMAAAFAGWSLLAVHVLLRPAPSRFVWFGLGIGALALVRPANQILVLLALVPLVVRVPLRTRLLSVLAVGVPAVAIIAGWSLANGLRYGDYTFSRGGNETVPFYRVYITDHLVRPDNGPASRELARAVQRDLLPTEPYRSYGIDLNTFFEQGSPRMQVDLIALSNRLWGWQSDARKLRDVGVEAVEAHPAAYTRGVATTMLQLLWRPVFRDLPAASSSDTAASAGESGGGHSGSPSGGGPTIVVGGKTLPAPSEGEPIPAPHEGGITTPDGSIYTVWTSPTDHHMVFTKPGAKARYVALHQRMDALQANLPDRSGNETLALRLNQASRWYVPPVVWLVIGIAALVWRRTRNALAVALPAVAALLVDLVSALGLPAEPHYSVPVSPAFVLLAAGALFAPRAAEEVAASRQPLASNLRQPA